MSVKSDRPIRPGTCSCRKITSRLGPLSARHRAMRRSMAYYGMSADLHSVDQRVADAMLLDRSEDRAGSLTAAAVEIAKAATVGTALAAVAAASAALLTALSRFIRLLHLTPAAQHGGCQDRTAVLLEDRRPEDQVAICSEIRLVSALAHHVHRTTSMGARVLINGTWY
jgi:hypothetical protein